MVDLHGPGGERDWRCEDAYDYTDVLPRRAWAWEFLRRDRDYQKAWSDVSTTVRIETPSPNLTVITAGAELAEMARWGLFFRRPARAGRDRGRRPLGPARLSPCPANVRAPVRSSPPRSGLSPVQHPMPRHAPADVGRHATPAVSRGRPNAPTRRLRREPPRAGEPADRRRVRPPGGASAAGGAAIPQSLVYARSAPCLASR